MLKRQGVLMPAIDLLGGAVVRLHQGRYDRVTHFGDDPLAIAHRFAAEGAEWLHVIDLDAARDGVRSPLHRDLIEQLAAVDGLELQLGGGIRSEADAEWAIGAGVARVLIGSLAVTEPRLVGGLAAATGRVAVAADCLDGSVRIHGWERDSEQPAEAFVDLLTGTGVRDFLVTAIGRDGTGRGPDTELLRALRPAIPGAMIAAGGVGNAVHVAEAVAAGADAVVVGRALMDGSLTVAQGLAAVR
jgi:phosphoribosylformimino-5-aminoimidazole carboxamide ribotide isomerase